MQIGLTYDLRENYLAQGYGLEETAEFDRIDTIEAIEAALQALGHDTDRIGNVKDLAARLVAGNRWDLVFNIAEGMHGIGREAQVPALLDAYGIPYTFSDPMVLSLTLHKGMTKRAIRDMGIPTPDFAVIETPREIDTVNLPFPLFAKPVAEGTGKGISGTSRITDREQLRETVQTLLEKFRQPVLVETFLPGREFTVGIVGTGEEAESVGVIEVILLDTAEAGAYSYENKAQYEERVEYRWVDDPEAREAVETSLRAWRGLGCRDGGRVDVRSDIRGIPNFIEVNPLAGLNPVHSDLPIICRLAGIPYQSLIERILSATLKRIGTTSGGAGGVYSIPVGPASRRSGQARRLS